MHIGLIEHLVHIAQKEYEKFHGKYDGVFLKSDLFTVGSKRSALKCKTIGLIRHDQVLNQDSRLPRYLKLEH